ncbi:DUF1868 domain-containing protein [Musicola paradisiaca]|uniref:DUF1868 domain-containing protein n=1 Tax=Musicola paradisiaca (strain Ech703) TaxID=579405 RepID=C6C3B4_MUSP7|nr:DUF1868 domain-containing protein [Musicola paradisiaca]ACS87212.1 Domain of unknown function DUF1868 [Musicola paradisiaca Ech703]
MNSLRRRFILQLPLLACGTSLFNTAFADDDRERFATMRPAGSTAPAPHSVDPGGKFHPDGSASPFPGNTLICPIPLRTVASDALMAVRNTLRQQAFSHCLGFTPPSSYHMTLFEGVTLAKRQAGFWPADLPTTASLADCTRHLAGKLAGFALESDVPFRLVIADFNAHRDAGATIRLTPADNQEERRLRTLRDRLADRLQIRMPDHDRYGFHITLAYLVQWMNRTESQAYRQIQTDCLRYLQQQVPVLALGVPEFCTFNDMFAFDTWLKLGQPLQQVPLSVVG